MAGTTQQELNWKLTGIRAEIKTATDYVAYLQEQERSVVSQLTTGGSQTGTQVRANKVNDTAKKGTTKVGQRKRQITEAQRKAMSDAQKARWAERKRKTVQTTGSAAVPVAPISMEIPQVQGS